MRRLRLAGASLLLVSLALPSCSGNGGEDEEEKPKAPDLSRRLEPGEVRAGVIEKEDDLIGGLKAEGSIGDLKLYNAKAAFIVEGVRPASSYRYLGGNLIDADVIRPLGEPGDDRFGEVFFAFDLQAFEPREIEVVSDGRDGLAHVRITGGTAAHPFADDVARVLMDPPRHDLEIVYDYLLRPDESALELDITVTSLSDEWIEIRYPLILANHGDGAHQFQPGLGFEGGGFGELPYIAAVGRDLSYALMAANDDISALFQYEDVTLLITDGFDLYPGESRHLDYYYVVTDESSSGLDAARRRLIEQEPTGTLKGAVDLPETSATEDAWVAVMIGASVASLVPVRDDGSFSVDISPRDYTVHAFAHRHAAADPVDVSITEDGETEAQLEIEPASRITSFVVDPNGDPVKARVTFFRLGDTPTPFAPASVRHGPAWPRGVSGAAYVIDDSETITLPAGEYRAVASRGPMWEMDETVVEVEAGAEASVTLVIEEAVDTTGWLSSDMHMHGFLSPDSHVPYRIRVKQAVTDALDIPLMTEHVWASSLEETAVEMGLEDEIIGVAGQEVTTFVYGHFNVFPLKLDPDQPNQGGVYEHGRTPQQLFADMRAQHQEDTIIQINHPRGTALPGAYFSWVGLDAEADTVANDEGWVLDWELIEVFNGSCTGQRSRTTLQDWIGMTNHGHRKGISGTSDSHTESRIPGTPRNWIQVDEDRLRADHGAIVAPMRERRSFVSCGPFIRFEAADGTGLGGLTTVDSEGRVELAAKVEAPTWMVVEELRLLENGEVIEVLDISGDGDAVVRFDGVLTAEPSSDAWYAIEVLGSGSMAPVTWRGPPYAITNPIEVDADGDGVWTPPAKQ